VDTTRIAALLEPFLDSPLTSAQLENISTYIDILLRWNARINLTAVRDPDEIATRHFGESLFAARMLFPAPSADVRLADVGSGAGFPGLPIKLWSPTVHLTLIESNHKKASFLREIIRQLSLSDVAVFADRAEAFPAESSDLVTLRAVERFDSVLPTAARLVAPTGRLALLIGQDQASRAAQLLPGYSWEPSHPIPLSDRRILLTAHPASKSPAN
jgi:16S rRNA (guanine527-N7)-methyltransferase